MKSFDSRAYSINDFVEWDKQGTLELNPAFQRRAVWNEKAKSFLMDTILRGKPIPKMFIAILSYIKDGFVVIRQQNKDHGGLHFSQLPEDIQSQILSYEVSVDLLINMPDTEVLDIFSRLNSYAIVLNEQERINANHFSVFKILADEIGRKYYSYWMSQGIISARNITRMAEVNLVADILIALQEGIKSKKQIKKFYDQYEARYDRDPTEMALKFDQVIAVISRIYPEGLAATDFSRPHLFYSLFTAVAHVMFGIPGLAPANVRLTNEAAIQTARNRLDHVGELFLSADPTQLGRSEIQFLADSRRATTDEAVRERRTRFLLDLMT
jgi:hypothetical protein